MLAVTPRKLLVITLLCSSAAATFVGMRALIVFDQTSGVGAQIRTRWPADSAIPHAHDRSTLLLFAHPFCGCTGATLKELARILELRTPQSPQPVIRVLFVRPNGSSWRSSPLWDRARQLGGAAVVWDDDGREARRFGVGTSGEVLLYGRTGNLLFHGGITGSRGHAGDNYGAEQLLAAVNSSQPAQIAQRVFGCALASAGFSAAVGIHP